MSLHLSGDEAFTESVATQYERYLVQLIFEPYATDLAARVTSRSPQRALEIRSRNAVAQSWNRLGRRPLSRRAPSA